MQYGEIAGQEVSEPVVITGIKFFDFPHFQIGRAKNVIEIHPIMGIEFKNLARGCSNAPYIRPRKAKWVNIGAVGQAEREGMLERQREGIAKAKREGRYKGRVPTARRQADEIIRLKEAGVRPTEIAVRLGIGRASVYRMLGEQ